VLVILIGLLPSFISQITFIHAVGLIGPARAGVFLNLVPIFGPLLAVMILGEPLSMYHAVALALVLGGIYVAETLGTRWALKRCP
jgi:drug/metabolite transporter (DMT)-like permease